MVSSNTFNIENDFIFKPGSVDKAQTSRILVLSRKTKAMLVTASWSLWGRNFGRKKIHVMHSEVYCNCKTYIRKYNIYSLSTNNIYGVNLDRSNNYFIRPTIMERTVILKFDECIKSNILMV